MMTTPTLANRLGLHLPSPLQPFTPDWPGADNVEMWIKRDDLIHPVISGNKWRKLSHLLSVQADSSTHIISFGGGFSNHLHALGWCCYQLGIRFTALVRGDYSTNPTPMLTDLNRWQADIRFVTKTDYQHRTDPDYLTALQTDNPDALIIPEGGSQQLALAGLRDMLAECEEAFDTVLVPVASGATLAGITSGLNEKQSALGIAVLKGVGYLESLVEQFSTESASKRWQIRHEFHHGGYARTTPELTDFCVVMQQQYALPVEPVYSGKLFYAVKTLLSEGFFAPGQRLLIVHTGGLQGARVRSG